jgi:ABC-type Zn2+ transport system substrate-binding protein/surface adhesin
MLLEPNVNTRQISPLVKGLNVNVTMTDPLAAYSTSYVQWVAQTTERFVNCLSAIETDKK